MKFSKNHAQTFIFIALYLFAVYFWSQPYHEKRIPYGEYDAMSHFEIADYISHNDKSFVYLPSYIDIRYGPDNKFMPHTLWYPPTFHTMLGIGQVFGNERMLPVYLLNTIMATFIIVTVYFVINSLYGFLPAILSSLLLIFSPRDFLPFLWGQWPERFAYAFLPIILYCFYKYFISYSKEGSRQIYIYLAALFLGISMLVHSLAFFHTVIALIVLYILLSIKQRKFVFNWKHVLVSALIFTVLFVSFPIQTFNIFVTFAKAPVESGLEKTAMLERLFQWSLNPEDYVGSVSASYFSYSEMHGLWTLPFLLLGIIFVLFRRQEKDILMISWMIGLYLVLHRDLIGKITFLHRSLSATAHIFAPLTAIGAVYLASLVKLPQNIGKYVKYGSIGLFVYLALTINMASASKILNKDTYNDFFGTLNEPEYQAAQWILENVPASANVTILGIPYSSNVLSVTSKKIRWFGAASQHVTRFFYFLENKDGLLKSREWYILMDYTMAPALKDIETINYMQEFEKNLTNHALVYNKNNIRVYKLA